MQLLAVSAISKTVSFSTATALSACSRRTVHRSSARNILTQLVSRRTMANSSEHGFQYDLLVIGGGSGGLACAKRAAGYGATAAVVEGKRYGGTCVNVGCVPKKVMYNTSHVNEVLHEAKHFGFTVGDVSFDWAAIKKSRDRYVQRLNGIYESGLDKLNIQRYSGFAAFSGPNTVVIDGTATVTAKHILIAVGGAPTPLGLEAGEEYTISSDGFFELETQPKKAAVIGAGYIAVELAGVLHGLGTDTSLLVRHGHALRTFDEMLYTHLDKSMKESGMNIVTQATSKKITKEADGTLTLHLTDGRSVEGFDCVLAAVGRHPLTEYLNLSAVGVETGKGGYITVDDFQNTSVAGIYALGDVAGKVQLTPMAIAAGRRLADRLFDGKTDAKADYDNVPTVVFSHPVIGTVGLTEAEAKEKYGESNLKIYTSSFVNLYYGNFFDGEQGPKPISKYKLICEGPTERVVGLHMIGMGSDEVLQGFGVAIKMGATKADFDSCIAIHPTAAEEMVTMPPWGMASKK